MKRALIATLTTLVAAVTLMSVALPAQAGDTQDFSFLGQSSGDSGTCGPDWATDTFTRVFQVYPEQNIDGSYRVIEKFNKGHFVTLVATDQPSPESCEAGTGNTVAANLKGAMHGSFVIKVSGGTYDPTGAAAYTGNSTAEFIADAFGGSATYAVSDYYFKYTTTNSVACAKKWINSATGNSGDIATDCHVV